jgi:hypothetical protein
MYALNLSSLAMASSNASIAPLTSPLINSLAPRLIFSLATDAFAHSARAHVATIAAATPRRASRRFVRRLASRVAHARGARAPRAADI